MNIQDEFRVDVPVEEAWRVLTDVERIAPCMPGAQLQEVEGDEFRGIVKVKVGPITAQYKGKAHFTEKDEANHRAVIRAEGRDTRGQGNASATVTAVLVPDEAGTRVTIDSDVTITGKVSQFGRGVIGDVSSKLLGQFVDNLERDVLSGSNPDAAPAAPTPSTPSTPSASTSSTASAGPAASIPSTSAAPAASEGPRTIDAPEAEPVDLLRTAGAPVLKRLIPVLAVIVVVVVVVLILLLR
ncbi:MAG TPA: SRPBCC family protein [Acidimicrobiia bacterium]|nr:SRPBCC family protein [Acidimicrobiia bacterium]